MTLRSASIAGFALLAVVSIIGEAASRELVSRDPIPKIPRIIHQFYHAGHEVLLHNALQPDSSFRKDWVKSCQVRIGKYNTKYQGNYSTLRPSVGRSYYFINSH
jgi:hypothetical protein